MHSKLNRTLNVPGLLAYYVTSVLGVGILIIPGIATDIAGPASLLSWLALILISYPFAITFAMMSIVSPDSSGIASFIEKAFGVRIGKTAAILLVFTMIIGNPVMGIATSYYLQSLIGFPDGWPLLLTGFGMMILSVVFNLLGLKIGSRIQTTTLLILILGLIGIVIFSIPYIRLDHLTPFNPHGWWAIGNAAVVCFFSFLGWENVSSVAEEVNNPERTYRKAVVWAVSIVGALYMMIAIVDITAIKPGAISNNVTVLSSLLNVIGGPIAGRIGNIIAVLLLILSTNAWVLGASRLVYALSRDGVLPKKLSYVSKSTGTPIGGLLTLTISYAVIILFLILTGSNERILINIANSNFMIIYLCAFFAGLKLFKSKGIRIATWISLLSIMIFLPFFRIGLLYSIVIIGISYWLFLRSISKEEKNHVYS